MSILIEPDSWLLGLAGGLLIGAASALLLLFNGRVAGISGILGGLVFDRAAGEMRWRWLFLMGLLLGPVVAGLLALAQPITLSAGWPGTILAGLLVGFGTRLGGGCTSGHGVCGLARFSKRSFVATATFMGFGFLTVFLLRIWGGT